MIEENNNALENLARKNPKIACCIAILLLENKLLFPNLRRKYRTGMSELLGYQLLEYVISLGRRELYRYTKDFIGKSQPTHSRKHVILAMDKTSDGIRYSKNDKYVSRQYTGSYGVIYTHGWFFCYAILGKSNHPQTVILGATPYIKDESESEWKEGIKLVEPVVKELFSLGVDKKHFTVVGDNKYMTTEAKLKLDELGCNFVGKEGGNKIETINGREDRLCIHARRDWEKYQSLEGKYLPQTNIEKYARLKGNTTNYIYYQGVYPPNKNGNVQTCFLVTNWENATAQWIFGKYLQRWWIEVIFRDLKQVCCWGGYRPRGDGERYICHTALVLLTHHMLNMIRADTYTFRSHTIGEVKKLTSELVSSSCIETVFIDYFAARICEWEF